LLPHDDPMRSSLLDRSRFLRLTTYAKQGSSLVKFCRCKACSTVVTELFRNYLCESCSFCELQTL
jgi:hypothetical protein